MNSNDILNTVYYSKDNRGSQRGMECLEKAETVDDSDQMVNVMTKIFFNITQVGGVV